MRGGYRGVAHRRFSASEEKGVEDSAAAERRAEVSERQLAFVRSLIFFYRARCHVCQIPSALGRNFARWNFFTAHSIFACLSSTTFRGGRTKLAVFTARA
jgi:hypothetical protein